MTHLLHLFLFLHVAACFAQQVSVSTATELQNALNAAVPGQVIQLADGVYIRSGGFYANANINGTAAQPITIRGNSNTIVSSDNLNTGYGFALKGNNYWILEGFTIYNSKKGLVLDNSHHNTISNISVNKIGDEGIHLRTYSSFNTVNNCLVDSTGLVSTGTGEGIYIGSAVSNWSTYTSGNPDTCNYNTVTNNKFGDYIVSENIDIKEGTTGGTIMYNQFNGKGLNGQNYADSWIDVKGNNYTVSCNTGQYTLTDGFQTHINYTGYGDYTIFSNNTLQVNASGYGINISTSSSNGTAIHNVVCSNNIYSGSGSGLTNVSPQSCTNEACTVTAIATEDSNVTLRLFPNPAYDQLTVTATSFTEFAFQIFDNQGQLRKQGKGMQSINIDIHDLPSGIYFFSIIGNGEKIKFLKY